MSTPTPMNPQPPPRRSVEPSGPAADLPTQPADKLEATFHTALSRLPAEREAYLAEACAGEEELLREVRALLKAHEEAGDFLTPAAPSPAIEAQMARLKPEEAGERIGPYKLLQQIGEGGFGTVWMAEQEQPVRRRVALKVIKLGMDTKQIVARFEQERQALAMMDHPNIAKVFDAGATPTGRPFFVMELVRGIKITDYCDQASLPTAERLQLFVAVCHAVQHAHQKGIIHRDLKPSNILVTLHDGVPVPKVIDFGVAKATQQRLTDLTVFTQFEQMIGTPLYMSPEQAEMSGLDIDTRSDIYSLGVLLYELLTGRTPFDPKELLKRGVDEIRRAIREQEPPRPSTALGTMAADVMSSVAQHRQSDGPKLLGLIRGDLDWIVMKAIEKNRTRRYDTANAFAEDIQRHLIHEPVVARPPSQLYRFQKAYHRNKLAFGAAAAVAIALVMGLGLATVGWRQARAERDGAERARKEAETARVGEAAQRVQAQTAQAKEAQLRVQAEAQKLAAQRRAYAADMNLAQQALAANNLQRARYLIERHRPNDGEKDLRGWEWRYLWQICRGDALFELCHQPQRVMFAGFSSDGQHVVTCDSAAKVGLWDITTKAEVSRLQDPVTNAPNASYTLGTACLSDDGEWLAAVDRDKSGIWSIKVWNLANRQLIGEFSTGSSHEIRSIALSKDKKTLAVFIRDDGVSLWDIATRQRNSHFAPAQDPAGIGAVTFSPDGTLLAIGDNNGRVRLLDSTTFADTASFTASSIGAIHALAFSPDSRVLAVGFEPDSRIALWDVPANAKLRALEGHRGYIFRLAFSPDGKTLASASADQTIKLWNTTTWMEERTLIGHVDEVCSVAYSRDGNTLVSSCKDGSIYVWPAHGVRSNHTSLPLPERGKDWTLSPDGESLGAVTSDGAVSAWKMATGEKKETPAQLGVNNAAIAWSETGEVVIGTENPPQIKVWNVARNSVAEYPLNSEGNLAGILCLPHTHTVLTIQHNTSRSNWTFKRWDLLAWKELSSFAINQNVNDVTVSSDARLLAIGTSKGKVIVRNLATGNEEYTFAAHTWNIHGLAIFPNDRLLASASTVAPIIKVWDLETRKEVATLRGHNVVISALTVSPDGQRLASTSVGQEPIKLWDATSWEEVANLEGFGATLSGATFLSDGNTLAAFDLSSMHLWRAPSWTEIEAAEKAGAR